MVTIEDQTNLEVEMVNAGKARFISTLKKMKEKGMESATKHGRAIMSNYVSPIAKAIEDLKDKPSNNRNIAKKKLQDIDGYIAAYISLIQIIDDLTKRCTLLKIAADIGRRLEDQIRLQLWIEQEGEIAKNLIRKANEKTRSGRVQKRNGLIHKMNKDGFKFQTWNNTEHYNVGLKVIDIVIDNTPLIQKKEIRFRNKSQYFIVPNEGTLEWVKKFNEVAEVARPRYTPTIVPPKDWKNVWGGGYYTIINDLPLVRVR